MIRSKQIVLYFLDRTLKTIDTLSEFISLEWHSVFRGVGSFTLVCAKENETAFQPGNFVIRNDDKSVFMVERVDISRDINGVKQVQVTGRSAVAMLDWRVIYEPRTLGKDTLAAIDGLLYENIGIYATPERRIPIFNKYSSIVEPVDYSGTACQVGRGSLYDAIMELLPEQYGIGVSLYEDVTFGETYRALDINFPMKVDKTKKLTAIYLMESRNSFAAWSFTTDSSIARNVAVVAGEGEGLNRKVELAGSGTGITRREVYVDARDLTSETDTGVMTDAQYRQVLRARGIESLAECQELYDTAAEVHNGEIELSWLGYIISVDTGVYSANVLISEITEIFDDTGYSIFPTFEFEKVYMNLATENSVDITTEDEDILLTEGRYEEI